MHSVQKNVDRYNPNIHEGLSLEQVEARKKDGLVNKTTLVVGKSVWEILRSNVFTFFNIMLFIIAGVMIYANVRDGNEKSHWYTGCFFIVVLLSNIIIGLYQDLKAKYLMKKMKIITAPHVKVIRNSKVEEIDTESVVLDDIISLKASDQITSDSVIKEGSIYVNESLLTGESDNVYKTVGDSVYSGTYVISGHCYAKVEKVGKENYVETLAEKAKAFKRNPSHILLSLKRLFRGLGILIITVFIIVLATYLLRGKMETEMDFINMIVPLSGQLVAMIPSGLYLLTSMALATGVVSLYRKSANVQDLYSIEMLARADTLCVDKTGTITDGSMIVHNVVPLVDKMDNEEIGQIVSNAINAIGDENPTALALKTYFIGYKNIEVVKTLPFNSDNKYSAASFASGVTYVLGAIEFLNITNKAQVLNKAEEYTSQGLRVICLARGNDIIKDDKYDASLTPLSLILLQDHIKEDALATFAWFKENGVQIKVISGDNAVTVSEIAKQAGIANADKYVSLEGKSIEEVRDLADQYVVFGRVTPEQKEAIVLSLKEKGKTVAMTGDGVNDILALKRADCSIAMNSGSSAAKNVSHVVLMNNDFSTMPKIVAEGRRVINNLQRTGSLFLTKTLFAAFVSIAFIVVSLITKNKYSYPFSTSNMMIWETFGFGLTSFFIALEPNKEEIKPGFLRNVFAIAIPCAVMLIVSVGVMYALYAFHVTGIMYTGVDSFGYMTELSREMRYGATAMATITFTALSFVVLYLTVKPLNKYRGIVFVLATIIGLGIMAYFGIRGGHNVLYIDFDKLTAENYIAILVAVIIIGAISITAKYIRDVIKGEK